MSCCFFFFSKTSKYILWWNTEIIPSNVRNKSRVPTLFSTQTERGKKNKSTFSQRWLYIQRTQNFQVNHKFQVSWTKNYFHKPWITAAQYEVLKFNQFMRKSNFIENIKWRDTPCSRLETSISCWFSPNWYIDSVGFHHNLKGVFIDGMQQADSKIYIEEQGPTIDLRRTHTGR